MTDTPGQERLQQYCDVGAAPVETPPPSCDRCGCEGDLAPPPTHDSPATRAEARTGYRDIRKFEKDSEIRLCGDCRDLHRYLEIRHAQVTNQPGVDGAVAVFCPCHEDDEVDVRPVRQGETTADVQCSRCGNTEVVLETLPPATDTTDGVIQ